VTAVVLAIASIVLGTVGDDAPLVALAMVPDMLGYVCVGCLLLTRRPRHRMGLLLCLIALTTAISGSAFAYARYALVHPHGWLPFATAALWMNTWSFAPSLCLGGFVLPMVFPDGSLLSRRWRPALWAALAFVPLSAAGSAFIGQNMGPYLRGLPNPYAIRSAAPLFGALLVLALICGIFAGSAAAASLVVRWRRADRVVRQQLKWFLAVLPVTAVTLVVDAFSLSPASLAVPAGLALGALSGVLVPTAIGIAVLRYRLYEIDVLLNRAAVYGAMTAAVAMVYLTVTGAASGLFSTSHGLVARVLVTALAALALWPMRQRVQRWVNRLFFGDRGAPYDALSKLARRVEQAADTEAALDGVVKSIADSLRLAYVAVELRQGDGWRPTAVQGRGSAPPQVVAFPLVFQRETVGRLLVGARAPGGQLGAKDERLLADLARQAGPAIHAVALRRALDASRAGLAATREEERRRLRRDLHDGLGPTLAGLTLGLDTALARYAGRPDLQDLLGRLKVESQRAVSDVRRIVYGLRPPALDELGLAGSLREEVGRLRCEAPALTVDLDLPGDGLADLPAAIEVACYRIVTEALTNVARHAQASRCSVRLWLDGDMGISVRDDGVGLADGWRAGVGIASMRERVAELGGDLVIGPGHPHGTAIAARLPWDRP